MKRLLMYGLLALALAGYGLAQAEAAVDPRVRVVQDYYEAYATGDLDNLRPFFADEIVWRIPGEHPLAGDKQGANEVLAFFNELNKSGFRAETLALAVDPDTGWVIDLHRGYSTGGEGELDILWALAFRVEGKQIHEAVNFAFDQAAANHFFWANYPLRPLPERLAEPNE